MAQKEPREHVSGLGDNVVTFLDGLGKLLAYGGGVGVLVSVGILIWSVINAGAMDANQIAANTSMFQIPAIISGCALALGVGWLMWTEEIAGPLMFIVGLILLIAPGFLAPGDASSKAQGPVSALAAASIPLIIGGLIMLAFDMYSRVKIRAIQGARAAKFQYGQNIKEEKDRQNVLLGKCWQLPYCRKFVRERCPIYHARRTCWKEQVGCMCEEQVIRDAMKGDVIIPKDMVAAAARIPRNNTLTPAQKKVRCMSCTIYNEHQKHKYRALLPVVVVSIAVFAAIMWIPITAAMDGSLLKISSGLSSATAVKKPVPNPANPNEAATTENTNINNMKDVTSVETGRIPYSGIMYFVIVLVAVAYGVKIVENLVFRYKI